MEPRPEYGDGAFSSKPGHLQPSADYGDSAFSSKPGADVMGPSTEIMKPIAEHSVNRVSTAQGGSQERSLAALGFAVSMRILTGEPWTPERQPQNCEAEAFRSFSGKKQVLKSDFSVYLSRKSTQICEE